MQIQSPVGARRKCHITLELNRPIWALRTLGLLQDQCVLLTGATSSAPSGCF